MAFLEHWRRRQVQKLWQRHRGEFLRLHSLEQSQVITLKDLTLAFVDLKGISYYQFPEGAPLPTERYGKLTEYLMWMDGGFHKAELLNMKDAMNKAFIAAAKDLTKLSVVGYLIEELGSRSEMVVHTELLFNMVAVTMVRQDENPEHFNEMIHAKKIIAFKEFVAERGSNFFFMKFPLKELKHLRELSESEWTAYWSDSIAKQERLKVMIKKLSSQYSGQGLSQPATTLN